MTSLKIIFGSLIFIFLTVYFVEEHLKINIRKNAQYYYRESLYATGLRERPENEGFVGMIVNIVKGVFKIMTNVTGIVKFFYRLVSGVANIIGGMALTISLGIWAFMQSLLELGIFIIYVVEFILTHGFCLVKLIFTAPSCLFWFLLETIGKIIYLVPMAIISGFKLIGIDLKPLEKAFWLLMERLDRIIYGSAGFHIIHFPKWVRDMCYNCQRLKMSAVGEQFDRFSEKFYERLPRDAAPGISLLNKGYKDLMAALNFALGIFG